MAIIAMVDTTINHDYWYSEISVMKPQNRNNIHPIQGNLAPMYFVPLVIIIVLFRS